MNNVVTPKTQQMMLTEQLYQQAFDAMPKRFTSQAYCKKLRRLGISEKTIRNDNTTRQNFLRDKCVHSRYSRCWVKKDEQITLFATPTITLNEAIQIIKAHGGKVLMPTTQYSEV